MLVSYTRVAWALPACCHCCCLACPVPECCCDAASGSYRSVIGTGTVCNMSQPDSYSLFTSLSQNCLVLSCPCRRCEQAIKVDAYSGCTLFTALVGRCCCCCLTVRVSEQWCGRGSHLVHRAHQECQKLQSIEVGLKWGAHLYDWQYLVHGCTALSLTDRTRNVLLDHLRDLDLATILARLADRSELYILLQ